MPATSIDYYKVLPLEYEHSGKLLVLKKVPDIVDIARYSKLKLSYLKKSYKRGILLMQNLIEAYYTFEKYSNEDLESYISENNLESLWEEDCKKLSYIPYIGIEEYAILHKYSPKILKNLTK